MSYVCRTSSLVHVYFFFFNDTATTEIYTLSLHDALPISPSERRARGRRHGHVARRGAAEQPREQLEVHRTRDVERVDVHRVGDRKSTRLNSSHLVISYAVFCLKKKKYNRGTGFFCTNGSC